MNKYVIENIIMGVRMGCIPTGRPRDANGGWSKGSTKRLKGKESENIEFIVSLPRSVLG